jgi:hypothetical protein
MEKRSRRRTRDLVTQAASQGLSENEIGCARISMMAKSTNALCKGRIQMRKTIPLHLLKFGLQRTAGPYSWVKLRNTRNEQIFSALPPITDILGDRLAKLSSGGRERFHSISNMASALPAPEQADKGLQSPCRLETGKFSTHSLSTTISRLRMNGRFARSF